MKGFVIAIVGTFVATLSNDAVQGLAPILADGTEADWFFTYKFNTNTYNSNACKGQIAADNSCIFGGIFNGDDYMHGLSYATAAHQNGKTSVLEMPDDNNCVGNGNNNAVANTFAQVYNGEAKNFVVWNDQFYGFPMPTKTGSWGHSKGVMAWDENGDGFVMQVSTPNWPKFAMPNDRVDPKDPKLGNTLGCSTTDNNVMVAQHFFSTKINKDDTLNVLRALSTASVVTNVSDPLLVQENAPVNSTFSEVIATLGQLNNGTTLFDVTLSSGIRLLSKPFNLNVAPWQMVGAVLQHGVRTANWYGSPEINSTYATRVSDIDGLCWDDSLPQEIPEVQVALTGQWDGKVIGLGDMDMTTNPGGYRDANHAKIGVSLDAGSAFAIMGDMNEMGCLATSLSCDCTSSQNGRGGMFFILEDASLHHDMSNLINGTTTEYAN